MGSFRARKHPKPAKPLPDEEHALRVCGICETAFCPTCDKDHFSKCQTLLNKKREARRGR